MPASCRRRTADWPMSFSTKEAVQPAKYKASAFSLIEGFTSSGTQSARFFR